MALKIGQVVDLDKNGLFVITGTSGSKYTIANFASDGSLRKGTYPKIHLDNGTRNTKDDELSHQVISFLSNLKNTLKELKPGTLFTDQGGLEYAFLKLKNNKVHFAEVKVVDDIKCYCKYETISAPFTIVKKVLPDIVKMEGEHNVPDLPVGVSEVDYQQKGDNIFALVSEEQHGIHFQAKHAFLSFADGVSPDDPSIFEKLFEYAAKKAECESHNWELQRELNISLESYKTNKGKKNSSLKYYAHELKKNGETGIYINIKTSSVSTYSNGMVNHFVTASSNNVMDGEGKDYATKIQPGETLDKWENGSGDEAYHDPIVVPSQPTKRFDLGMVTYKKENDMWVVSKKIPFKELKTENKIK